MRAGCPATASTWAIGTSRPISCEVIDEHGHADILINNASVVIADTLEDITYADFHWLMEINFWGVVHNTKAFLPVLKERPEAHIVNISSIDGVLATPNNGPIARPSLPSPV